MNGMQLRKRLVLLAAALMFTAMGLVSIQTVSAELVAVDEGVWMDELGATATGEVTLILVRVTLEPGAELRSHRHPGASVVTVESGTLESIVIRGGGTIFRGQDDRQELIASGERVTLQAGDALAIDGDCSKTVVNAGGEALVLMLTLIGSDGADVFEFDTFIPGSRTNAH